MPTSRVSGTAGKGGGPCDDSCPPNENDGDYGGTSADDALGSIERL